MMYSEPPTRSNRADDREETPAEEASEGATPTPADD